MKPVKKFGKKRNAVVEEKVNQQRSSPFTESWQRYFINTLGVTLEEEMHAETSQRTNVGNRSREDWTKAAS